MLAYLQSLKQCLFESASVVGAKGHGKLAERLYIAHRDVSVVIHLIEHSGFLKGIIMQSFDIAGLVSATETFISGLQSQATALQGQITSLQAQLAAVGANEATGSDVSALVNLGGVVGFTGTGMPAPAGGATPTPTNTSGTTGGAAAPVAGPTPVTQ